MEKVKLGEQQAQALEEIRGFLLGDDFAFCLYGSAGTGKSFMVKQIIKLVSSMKKQYCLVAPTHKAALVMRAYTGERADTLHYLLALSPNLEILKLDLNQLEFQSKSSEFIPIKGVVICDEASMINDDLYDILIEKCSELNTKVIFCGDIKQLQPVEGRNYSKVFQLKNRFELTKIYRQKDGSAIAPLLLELRNDVIGDIETKESEHGSLYVYDDIKEYADQMVRCFKEGIERQDVLYAKALAYTNNRVAEYNRVMHQLVFGKAPYYKGEILTAYSNFNGKRTKFFNSMDYIIAEEPITTEAYVKDLRETFLVHMLTLKDPLSGFSDVVYMMDKNNDEEKFDMLAAEVEGIRVKALNSTGKRKSMFWSMYFRLTETFVLPLDLYYEGRMVMKKGLDYGYAITVHKSQGSSISKTFVDLRDIRKQKIRDELRQLEYVALSRASGDVFIYE